MDNYLCLQHMFMVISEDFVSFEIVFIYCLYLRLKLMVLSHEVKHNHS